ncbi:uncharacterized protein E0L32_006904 [Thyridium curvatum]|uniref:Heterokaryon incompatibility domain-containing protein n=1 Tax=Thyridium curvatum TaxID=1093900 RepID=A0A507AR59_9PEZI|nr:uncharacterized protein E0L32_006904 [Thyridium curvatum]TPX12492.1 hypothetical protein E0L32_006904 [Thyridium curvatum]
MSSSSYDVAAILAALDNFSTRAERVPNNRAVRDYLLNKGISDAIANPLSKNEFCYWRQEELDEVFNSLRVTSSEVTSGLLSFTIQGDPNDPSLLIKPTFEEIKQSARALGALCVNRNGEFCVNPDAGYAALSHVWSQGMGADDENRGLHKSLLDQVFALVEPLGIRWIWTDSLAIPGGKRALNVAEEEVKAILINAMADIYRNARTVIVFDALCLRLDSTDPEKTAAVLACGTWATRVWTYQEIKLATNAVIATKAGFVGFADMVGDLESKARSEVGENYLVDAPGKYPSLCKTFRRLRLYGDDVISLPDIAIGCGYRNAWDPLDYARAMFPTLQLKWRLGDGLDDAMQKVYTAQKRHATRLALFHGPPRASWPGWAPATFPGLVDCKINTAGVWKKRGMSRKWLTSKVRRIVPSKPGCLVLELENGQDPGAYTVGFISEETQKKSPESVREFEKAVSNGSAYLLSDEPLIPKKTFSRVGLLVERFPKSPDFEAWVCLTLAVGETEETYLAEEFEWLLLHENPVSERTMSGKGASELNYQLECSSRWASPGHQGRLPLHQAAESDDVAELISALTASNVNDTDERNWMPLHCAASAGSTRAVRVLKDHGAVLNAATIDGQTPLILAVEYGHQDTVFELIEAGVDINDCTYSLASPLTAAIRRGDAEMTRLVLALGADPSQPDGLGFLPLISAVTASELNEDEEESTELLDALLEAGAEVDGTSTGMDLTALAVASRQGSVRAMSKLLDAGANPNAGGHSCPPIYFALTSRSFEAVQMLVEAGATVDGDRVRFGKEELTPMMCAAEAGDINIGRLLLKKGAVLDATSSGLENWTALHIAVHHKNDLFAKWLTEEAGARTDIRDQKGRLAFDIRNSTA